MADNRPIGLFDSGVGGLTVLRAVRRLLPDEELVYLGDTARVPYGNKGPETIERYSLTIARTLQERGCKAIVIACNTASAFGLRAVREQIALPVVDVIAPVAEAVAALYPTGHVAVLGTRGTVASGAYVKALQDAAPAIRVTQQACPLFVPLAEEGWTHGLVTREVVRTYLAPLFAGEPPDALILGCTHYPLLIDAIRETLRTDFGGDLPIHESGPYTAQQLGALLDGAGLRNDGSRTARVTYLATDHPASFQASGGRFLGEPIAVAEHVDVG